MNPVETIVQHYQSQPPGVLANLRRLFYHGRLAGTGKLLILPVDQGFEHGPTPSFAPNPSAYHPDYHPRLALEAGCSAYAAPLGFLEAIAHDFAGTLPLILKVNSSDALGGPSSPLPAITASVQDALRLGCSAIGYTIYPASSYRNHMYQDVRDFIHEARQHGLVSILWAYPRGNIPKEAETALDVIAYSAHIACQLGAHIVKVKTPSNLIWNQNLQKHYQHIPHQTLSQRVHHILQAAFHGTRILLFSGGPSKNTNDLLQEVRHIASAGATGSILGRNAFQRTYPQALQLLQSIISIYQQHS